MTIESIYEKFIASTGVCTDTRTIKQDSIFFALKGGNFNANEFAEEALNKGAAYAVIDEVRFQKDERFILVQDVLSTLQALAHHHRLQFSIPFIAITGSNGKTTTKELINAVLSKKYKTYATIGNLNNHIGVPLTLLSITKDIEIAIIEMGANHQKEIESYCRYTEPTHGLITNIGKAHLEGFGGIEGVKKGKGELYDFLRANQRKIFVSSSNETLKSMANIEAPIYYPQQGDFYHCEFIDALPYIQFKAENETVCKTHLAGAYNFDNIAAALCIGKFFGVDESLANEAICEYDPQNNRSQIVKKNTNAVIMDCYNANPTSMKAALESFANNASPNKVIIIGDMYELGDESEAEHAGIGKLISQLNFEKVILCGKAMQAAKNILGTSALHFETRTQLEEWLKEHPITNSNILLKGSRGMAMEKVMEWL